MAPVMLRAFSFWEYVDRFSKTSSPKMSPGCRVLDIGCGWGRITRFFARDFLPSSIFGIDIDPDAIAICKSLGVNGTFIVTKPSEGLPFPENYFQVITASSVFTHLPENVATKLVHELSRVAAPGCIFVFTVEDEYLLSLIAQLGENPASPRWQLLSKYKNDIHCLKRDYKEGNYIYLTTNDEAVRSSSVYGDAIVSKEWVLKNWGHLFNLLEYVPSKPHIYQAVVVMQKKAAGAHDCMD
jgi:SAM-dependent methyltransferase